MKYKTETWKYAGGLGPTSWFYDPGEEEDVLGMDNSRLRQLWEEPMADDAPLSRTLAEEREENRGTNPSNGNVFNLWNYDFSTCCNTVKSVGSKLGEAYRHLKIFTDAIAEQQSSVKNQLIKYIWSVDLGIITQFSLMERLLSFPDCFDTKSIEADGPTETNLHLLSLGYVRKMPLASRTSISVECPHATVGVPKTVALHIRDYEGRLCDLIDHQQGELRAVLVTRERDFPVSLQRGPDVGEYILSFQTTVVGQATLSVKLYGMDVAGSPVNLKFHPKKLLYTQNRFDNETSDLLMVHPAKTSITQNPHPTNVLDRQNHLAKVLNSQKVLGPQVRSRKISGDFSSSIFFGNEGTLPGEFSRPWGVGCDSQGRILVADRSNNRVQIFKDDGAFLFSFGRKGTGPGEFNLVTGVAGTPDNKIVTVDKDNHRIQIFDDKGKHLRTFGEFGDGPGQFNYPWDVDVNVRGEIAVTDSKNNRVQLFDCRGKFIMTVGKSDLWPDCNSPRGVSFVSAEEIVVSDFNTHKLTFIHLKQKRIKSVSYEGDGTGQLKRPQGVAWHPRGFVVVGDSRNDRVQGLDKNGVCVWQIGAPNITLDRPCGVAVSKNGAIFAVDFGHNRFLKIQQL